MLNGRVMLLGILCVLFVTSTMFAQSQSDTRSSNPALLEMQLTIIKEIHASEDKMRDHIDKSEKQTRDYIDGEFSKLNGEFSKLNGEFSKLDKEVAVLNNAKWYISIIVAPISVYYIILLIQMFRNWNSDRKIETLSKGTLPPEESSVDTDDFLDNTQPNYQTAGGGS